MSISSYRKETNQVVTSLEEKHNKYEVIISVANLLGENGEFGSRFEHYTSGGSFDLALI
jgi:hypothetical protein